MTTDPLRKLTNVIVVDVETTGCDAGKDSMIGIGALRCATGERFAVDFRPWPGARLDPGAVAVHGMDRWELDCLALGYLEGVGKFWEWLGAQHPEGMWLDGHWVMAGWNVAFDFQFISAALEHTWADANGRPRPFSWRVLDVHGVARVWAAATGYPMPENEMSTDVACAMMGVAPEYKGVHTPSEGVRWVSEVLGKLVGNLETAIGGANQ